jgi:Protein of unknown function (DUF2442)
MSMKTLEPLPSIHTVQALPDFKLAVGFDNGERRCFDVSPYLDRGVFQALRNPLIFARVCAHPSFVEWPGEIDLSADTLYLKGQPMTVTKPIERDTHA